ncbi:hypothetical protein OS493_035851 [Desmophyllum pertusum]|uniref:Uncharacterized protein n=1 Tax=Desmophyllum pertusum TaxID=174260 RepID=A0A9W9ZVQ1_9CNID|nr:hypothetical protein OS493_035851 [Desmophyllum pertusum]
MAADPSHLPELYESDSGLVHNYCAGFTDQQCYAEMGNSVENGESVGHINPVPADEAMSVTSSSDDSAAAAAVFRHLDNLMRQRIDGELEHLKSNVHRILSDQQQEFAQAFGLQDDHSSSEASTSHVVPQSNYGNGDDTSSGMTTTNNSSVQTASHPWEQTATRQEEADKEEEEKIAMNYLLRLMTASSKLANTLKRREYRT